MSGTRQENELVTKLFTKALASFCRDCLIGQHPNRAWLEWMIG